jgi:hypothetical protein
MPVMATWRRRPNRKKTIFEAVKIASICGQRIIQHGYTISHYSVQFEFSSELTVSKTKSTWNYTCIDHCPNRAQPLFWCSHHDREVIHDHLDPDCQHPHLAHPPHMHLIGGCLFRTSLPQQEIVRVVTAGLTPSNQSSANMAAWSLAM